MELKVWVDGVVRVVCGLSEETSCQDVVIALAQAIGQTGRYVLIQRLRDTERQLLANERPLESLAKLGQHGSEVQFYLRRTGPSSSSSSDGQDQHDRSLPLHKASEPEPIKRGAPKKSLTFNLGPSSSPRAKLKQSRKSLGHRDSPELRASPSPVPFFLPGPSKEEVFRHVLQQQERLHALEAKLEVLEHETQSCERHPGPEPRLQEEMEALEKTMMRNQAELAHEELWEEELRAETEREKAMRRRLGELHAKLDECGRRLLEFTARSAQLEQDIQRERLQAERPPGQAGPEESVGVVKAELQSQQKHGEELEVELVETVNALGMAEDLLQTKQEELEELNKELRQCNLQQFIQQTGALPATSSSRTDLHQQLDQLELVQLLQNRSIDNDSPPRPTAKQFLGHPRNLQHPLVSSLNPEVLTSRESSWR
ncbi:ras association domain-containing protein 7 [Astyanax mexicanus]|uniref:ras association domain-containing protein 7 n=1 Tax=Astyanax mexicanus TaxID=7994 RepID=UPI0020CABA69|nr:ras association domain-containing protein 7 [Astyanax mexicanus]XP_007228112.3 ras association domain-containing protein 7 [Astyanax mexicanus]XP_007228113.3 ras association domain-containing protein 7 [Astyanax mexicanus]XP_015456341.3 ras association domain-containing protein 7 [Astyanax mexicanus]XP_022527832.2 ras association domain-containing protein 7 [Astyanax mexicanus]XP_022527834.2 ras association domain-containing protein 7 [Astyanax mexicanus]